MFFHCGYNIKERLSRSSVRDKRAPLLFFSFVFSFFFFLSAAKIEIAALHAADQSPGGISCMLWTAVLGTLPPKATARAAQGRFRCPPGLRYHLGEGTATVGPTRPAINRRRRLTWKRASDNRSMLESEGLSQARLSLGVRAFGVTVCSADTSVTSFTWDAKPCYRVQAVVVAPAVEGYGPAFSGPVHWTDRRRPGWLREPSRSCEASQGVIVMQPR